MWNPSAALDSSVLTSPSPTNPLAIVFLTVTLFYISRHVQKQRADAYFATQHGCLPLVRLRTKWPLGLDLVWTVFQNAKAQTILQFFVQVVEHAAPTFEQNVLGASGINTVDPKNIESILATQFSGFGFGDRPPTFAPLLGDGIFTQQGRAWKHSREMLRPLFSTNRVNNFTQIQEHVERLISCIPENQVVDFQPLFFRLTLDTTTYLLFGRSINSLGTQSAQSEAFAESFRVAQYFLAQRGRLGSFYWVLGGKGFRDACAKVHEFIDGAIQDALAAANLNKISKLETASDYVFLDALMKETQDPKVLRDQLLNILLAGRDTTACCLTWTFRLLAQHQTVLLKLRNEIEAITGVGPKARHPHRKDLKKMTYLSFILKEVLRLYPSVPINSRSALQTTTLPVGGGADGTSPVLVKKGKAVGYCIYAMHRRKDLYGSDAEKFRPERWDPDEDNEVNLKSIGWGYLPFNGGPRICLGQEFALLEASYVIVRLLQTFERFEYGSEHQFVELGKERQDVTLVLASADGCQIRVRTYDSGPQD